MIGRPIRCSVEEECMYWRARLLFMGVSLALSACITGFTHPLGEAEDGFIESNLLGTWACTSVDDPTSSLITLMDFDGRQYYIQFSGGSKAPSHYRAIATRIDDVGFLSARELKLNLEDDWSYLEYALSDASHLELRLVAAERFEDVVDDPPSVRQRLAVQLQDPEVVTDLLSCARQDGKDSNGR
jgi:hypothetical protein